MGTLQCVTIFGYRKILCLRGLCHDFLSKFFCLTVPKKNVSTNRCIGKLRVSQKLFAKVGSGFSVENFLSHSTEKRRGRTLLCFGKFLVSKSFMHRRGESWSRKFFVSQDRENSKGNPSVFQKYFWYRKIFMDRRGWGITFFRRKNFGLTVLKNFVGEPILG